MRVALPLSLTLTLTTLAAPLATLAATLVTLAISRPAAARPLSLIPDDRPWTRGTLMPSFGLGGSFGSRGGGSLSVGAGLNYFFVNNLALGLQLRNFTTFLPPSYKSAFPGIEKQIPTNEFSLIPSMTAILYRSYRFSPYVFAGVGPVFLNHKRGVIAEWNAGPGVLIGLGPRIAIDLGINFSMRFPGAKCDAAYTYTRGDVSVLSNACGFRWGIRAGLVFGFGVGRPRNPPPPAQAPYPPASAPPGYIEPTPGYTEPAQPQPGYTEPAQPQPGYTEPSPVAPEPEPVPAQPSEPAPPPPQPAAPPQPSPPETLPVAPPPG